MPSIILGLSGQAGCGKGTIVDLLKAKFDVDYFVFSSILKDVLIRLHHELTRENFIKLSEALRKSFGEDALSYAIEHDALASNKQIVIIDGIRRPEDIVALEPLPQFKLLAIEVPAEIRFERMKKRGEKAGENDMTWERFLAEDQAPTEITIPSVMKRAWKTISNAGTREELETQLNNVLEELNLMA